MIRCFIALTIPDNVQQRLAEIQKILKQHNAQTRWVKPENIHMTLRFLGDQEPSRANDIAEALPEIFSDRPPLCLRIDMINAFPDPQNPRILWAGVSQGSDAVIRLVDTLNSGLARLGISRDADQFIPHFTLARCKTKEESRSCADAMKKAPTFSIEACPHSITLYQSTLTANGSIYQPIKQIPCASAFS